MSTPVGPPAATGRRITWDEVPGHVRAAVEQGLGARVVSAVSQPGGFSPGSADRVLLADGRRAFVKSAGTSLNRDTPVMHRREIAVNRVLPPGTAPRLLAEYDDGDWVALAFEEVDGDHPQLPWSRADVALVLAALSDLGGRLDPAPGGDLPRLGDYFADDFLGWDRVLASPPVGLDPWAAEHLDMLARLGAKSLQAMAGTALQHGDVRADNMLVSDGRVVLVDWPHAAVGVPWFDVVTFAVNPALFGGHRPEDVVAGHPNLADADDEAVTAVLAGITGYFVDAARRPGPPGLPTLRPFQAAQGEVTLGWLRRRLTRSG